MKENTRGEFILALFFLAFFVTLLLISMTYSPKARRLPLLVGIPGASLTAAQVIKELNRRRGKTGEAKGVEPENAGAASQKGVDKRLLMMLGWLVLLIAMIWILGFLITIPVYTILFMKSLKESWRLSIIFAVAGFAVLYCLFVVVLNMELYPGLVFQALR